MVIVWDVAAAIAHGNSGDSSGEELHRLMLHKVKVQDLAFSANSAFLATLGGADDNNLVVWDVASGKAVCGAPAASHAVTTVRWCGNCIRVLGGVLTTWHSRMVAQVQQPRRCARDRGPVQHALVGV